MSAANEPMISWRTLGFALPRIPWNLFSSVQGLDLPSVQIHEIEEAPEKRARTLKHLIRANHINHSIIYHNLQFHNHAPHVLGSAYLLGADVEQLHAIYEKESEVLEEWEDAPGEIAKHDWRDYLGKREYQRAWVDFYEDQLVQNGYDWRGLLEEFLFEGKEPLVNNLIAGLGHPLIHLGYAFELHSHTLAIEALALVSAFYDKQHHYLDNPKYTKPSPWSSDSPLEVLHHMHKDPRFSTLNITGTASSPDTLTSDSATEALVLEYWNALTLTDLSAQFAQAQRTAIAALVSTRPEGGKYDFFLVHILTTSHALRISLPLLPKKWHLPLLRQWWLFVVTTYIQQGRPLVSPEKIAQVELKGRDWKWIDDRAVNGEWRLDAHFVKGLRAMKVVQETWGDKDEFALKAAVRLAESFEGWGGFGVGSEDEEREANRGGL